MSKLEELGLAVKEKGEYHLTQEDRVGVLKQFMKIDVFVSTDDL